MTHYENRDLSGLNISRLILSAAILLFLSFTVCPLHAFAASWQTVSPLASGKWVKIKTSKTGIYEISAEKLREMGFNDPGRVAVYGRGAHQLQLNFKSSKGKNLYEGDLVETPALRQSDKLYFYATGPEELTFVRDDDMAGGYYTRSQRNIYSDYGYYFLTEKESPLEMKMSRSSSTDMTELTEGYGYCYHELDLEQNSTGTGQLFWGESFTGNSLQSWSVDAHDYLPGSRAVAHCIFYTENKLEGTLSFGSMGAEDIPVFPLHQIAGKAFRPQQSDAAVIKPGDSLSEFFVRFESADKPDFANLDYWILTYRRAIPQLRTEKQSVITLDAVAKGTTGHFNIPANSLAFDITDTTSPVCISAGTDAYIEGSGTPRTIAVFDTATAQNQISSFCHVENRDMRSEASADISFVIITVPSLSTQAEQLAQLHREHDRINVMVVTAEEVYNEFSNGVPDPMAYRALVKFMRDNGSPRLKNLLLLGQVMADFRKASDPFGILIGFQNPYIIHGTEAANANDFFGMTDDYLNLDKIERGDTEVGVGLLPMSDSAEASTYIEKVKRYLDMTDHSLTVNETFTAGGLGDYHTHDLQAIDLADELESLTGGNVINSRIIIDALGYDGAKNKLISDLNRGKSFGIYIGHGALTMLDRDKRFFNIADAMALRNSNTPFMVFAGCDLSEPDLGTRGIGEIMVLGSQNGLIGALLATRPVWSGQNYELAKRFLTLLYRESTSTSSAKRTSSPTIGEVYAAAKNSGSNSNDLAFVLMCDPAIKIQLAHNDISVDSPADEISPGTSLYLSGSVKGNNGEQMPDFNGKLKIKILEPEETRKSADVVTGNTNGGITVNVKYADKVASVSEADIKEGLFSSTIDLPSSFSLFEGMMIPVHFSSFDGETGKGASGKVYMKVNGNSAGDPTVSLPDTLSPVISDFRFDKYSSVLSFRISDDRSFMPGRMSLTVTIDGENYSATELTASAASASLDEYLCQLPLPLLHSGSHTVTVGVTDRSSNKTEETFSFESGDTSAPLALTVCEHTLESVKIKVDGQTEISALLTIIDSRGLVVKSVSMTAGMAEWDFTAENGERVGAGLYRTFATTPDGTSWSKPIFIPVTN